MLYVDVIFLIDVILLIGLTILDADTLYLLLRPICIVREWKCVSGSGDKDSGQCESAFCMPIEEYEQLNKVVFYVDSALTLIVPSLILVVLLSLMAVYHTIYTSEAEKEFKT